MEKKKVICTNCNGKGTNSYYHPQSGVINKLCSVCKGDKRIEKPRRTFPTPKNSPPIVSI